MRHLIYGLRKILLVLVYFIWFALISSFILATVAVVYSMVTNEKWDDDKTARRALKYEEAYKIAKSEADYKYYRKIGEVGVTVYVGFDYDVYKRASLVIVDRCPNSQRSPYVIFSSLNAFEQDFYNRDYKIKLDVKNAKVLMDHAIMPNFGQVMGCNEVVKSAILIPSKYTNT